ncbi:hypothetical protein AAHE18_18G214200 [Arachis hypogaea]
MKEDLEACSQLHEAALRAASQQKPLLTVLRGGFSSSQISQTLSHSLHRNLETTLSLSIPNRNPKCGNEHTQRKVRVFRSMFFFPSLLLFFLPFRYSETERGGRERESKVCFFLFFFWLCKKIKDREIIYIRVKRK